MPSPEPPRGTEATYQRVNLRSGFQGPTGGFCRLELQMKHRVPKGVEKRTAIKMNEKPQTLVSLPAARFRSQPPQPCLVPKTDRYKRRPPPRAAPKVWLFLQNACLKRGRRHRLLALPRVRFGQDEERSGGTQARTAGTGANVRGPRASEDGCCPAFESRDTLGSARRAAQPGEGAACRRERRRPFALKSLTYRRARAIAPLSANLHLKPGAKDAGLAHVRSGLGSHQTQRRGERRLVDVVLVVQWRRLEHAGGPAAFGTVLWLVTAITKAHPPAQGPPLVPQPPTSTTLGPLTHLGALPTRSTFGQGAYGETEAQSTPVTKPLLIRETITKYPAGAWWDGTGRPQELPADGPMWQGAAFPLPAALQARVGVHA